MPATMLNMELIHADSLSPDQLMEGDLVEIEEGIVEVISLKSDATGDNYFVEWQNEFGERDEIKINVDKKIKLFVFIENNE